MTSHRREIDIEPILEEAGARWRSEQRPLPELTIGGDHPHSSLAGALRVLMAGALVAVVALFGLTWSARTPAPPQVGNEGSQPPPSAGNARAVVEDGDSVSAVGRVTLTGTAAPVLCRFGLQLMPYRPELVPSCSGVRVPLAGPDLEGLPGWRSVGEDAWISDDVRVLGTWQGGVIEVASAVAADAAPPFFPPRDRGVPCPTPAGGWPDAGDLDSMEAATARLEAEIAAYPTLYVGSWWASGPSAPAGAAVVGTVDGAGDAIERLEEKYPYALCVVRFPYSRAALDAAAGQIAAMNSEWVVNVWPPLGKVLVQVPVLDASAHLSLKPFGDKVEVQALVRHDP
jgi:hypothetical protein